MFYTQNVLYTNVYTQMCYTQMCYTQMCYTRCAIHDVLYTMCYTGIFINADNNRAPTKKRKGLSHVLGENASVKVIIIGINIAPIIN